MCIRDRYNPKRLDGELERMDALKEHLTSFMKFDKDGNFIESIQYENPTKIYRKRTYKRNKKGELQMIKVFDGEDELVEKIMCSSDKKNNTRSQESYVKGKVSNIFHIKLDDNGNQIKTINESVSSSKKWINENEYNDANQLIKSTRIFPDGRKDMRTYEYDENGNETKSISKKSGGKETKFISICLLYTSPSPRDLSTSRMPSSA